MGLICSEWHGDKKFSDLDLQSALISSTSIVSIEVDYDDGVLLIESKKLKSNKDIYITFENEILVLNAVLLSNPYLYKHIELALIKFGYKPEFKFKNNHLCKQWHKLSILQRIHYSSFLFRIF